LLGVLACLALCAAVLDVRAQGAPVVVPPRRADTGVVPYPAPGRGHAEVVIEIVVDRDGNVTESRVVDGEEPFAGAALDASRSWRFQPATQQGNPVAARIRVSVSFDPPPAVTPPEATSAAPTPATPAPRPAVAEVNVHGVRVEPGAQEVTGSEVRQMPGSFGDAFRAIEALPGVTPVVSGLPYFLVRGAPPGNTGFFIDGVRVPALFHLGVGAAVVHPGLIDRVDFYPGAYPAHFGRFTGGILSGEVLPPAQRPHAEASLRLLDAGALVSSPVAGGQGTVLASGRYGYPGPLISLFAPNISLGYWDYQTRATWRATDRDEVGAFVFGSFDSLSQSTNGGPMHELLGYQFHRADFRWDRRTSDSGRLRLALTLGYDRSAGSSSEVINNTIQTWQTSLVENGVFGLRAAWSDRIATDLEAGAGADAVLVPYRVSVPIGSPATGLSKETIGTSTAEFLQTDYNAGIYGELAWHPVPRVELRPGVRVDAFTSRYPGQSSPQAALGGFAGPARAAVAVDPRLSARWQVTEAVAWTAALGVAHQASNIPLPAPGLEFSQLSRGVQASYQTSTGAEVRLPAGFTATGNVFVHEYTGLADYYETCPPGQSNCSFNGQSVGLELLVRRSLTQRLTGWLGYTLSSTERDAFYQGTWVRRPSEFDRTHVANVVLAADLGKRWRAGARLVAYSGLPYSTTTGMVGPPDARAPPFFRLDLRVERKWQALGGTMTLVFEWLNALLNKEPFGTTCSANVGASPTGGPIPVETTQCQPNDIGPITFPSVGIEAAW
jgi:TonB family protein